MDQKKKIKILTFSSWKGRKVKRKGKGGKQQLSNFNNQIFF